MQKGVAVLLDLLDHRLLPVPISLQPDADILRQAKSRSTDRARGGSVEARKSTTLLHALLSERDGSTTQVESSLSTPTH